MCDTSVLRKDSNSYEAPQGAGRCGPARQWRRLHAPPDHQQHVGLGLLSGRLLGRQLGACHSGAETDPRDRAAFLRNNWWLFCQVSRNFVS